MLSFSETNSKFCIVISLVCIVFYQYPPKYQPPFQFCPLNLSMTEGNNQLWKM